MIDALLKLLAWAALHVREVPPGSNAGEYVESFQRFAGGQKGDSWCCEFAWTVGQLAAIVSGGFWPIPRTGSCETVHQYAISHRLVVGAPRKGDLYLLLDATGHAHHIGFVTAFHVTTFDEISGNTTQATGSSEGWGVFPNTRKVTPSIVFVRWSAAPTPLTAPT